MQLQIIVKVDDGQGVKLDTYDSRVEGSVDAAVKKARERLDKDFPCMKQREEESERLPPGAAEPLTREKREALKV